MCTNTHAHTQLKQISCSYVWRRDWWDVTEGFGGLRKHSGVAQLRDDRLQELKKEKVWWLERQPPCSPCLSPCFAWICIQAFSSDGPFPACPSHDPSALTHLGKVEFKLLAIELGLVQLDASAGCGLWGAEVDPDSPEAFEHLESCLFIVDPKQRLKSLLQGVKQTGEEMMRFRDSF